MAIIELTQLPAAGPLLGLDPGKKTIGVAVSDTTRLIATAIETIKRAKLAADAQRLFELYDERGCVGFVIGLPINMDGSEGPRAQSTRAFAANVLAIRDTPTAFWDERLSTAAVQRTLITADASRARRAEVVDKLAAAYILQGALDRLREPPL